VGDCSVHDCSALYYGTSLLNVYTIYIIHTSPKSCIFHYISDIPSVVNFFCSYHYFKSNFIIRNNTKHSADSKLAVVTYSAKKRVGDVIRLIHPITYSRKRIYSIKSLQVDGVKIYYTIAVIRYMLEHGEFCMAL